MRESERKKRTYIIVGLCSILMIMAVGFAVFSQQLQINSTSEVTGDWCLGFDNTKTNTLVATPGIQTGTTPTGSMTYGGSTCGTKSQVGVTLASTFKQPGDSIEYTLTILNEGSLNAAIKSILVDNTSVTSDQTITKGNIKYKIEMPLSTSVAASGSTTMKVTASFQNDVDITRSFGGDSASIEVKINAEQDDGNGGFVSTNPYTGTIYRNSSNEVKIGDYLNDREVAAWCEVGTYNGQPVNSCDDGFSFNSQSECESDLADWILSGEIQSGDITCQSDTITQGGIGEYTKSQSQIQSQYDYYLKHTVVDDVITETYVCFVSDTEHCMRGGINEFSSANKPVFDANTQIIRDYQTYYNLSTNNYPGCYFQNYGSVCEGGGFLSVGAYKVGHNTVYKDSYNKCDVDESKSYCETVSVDQTYVPQYYEYHEDYNISIGDVADTSDWSGYAEGTYLGHDVSGGNVSANYVCFVANSTQYCMKSSSDGSTYATNKALLGSLRDAGIISCDTFDNSQAICSYDGPNYSLRIYARSDGNVSTEGLNDCFANEQGNSYCENGED